MSTLPVRRRIAIARRAHPVNRSGPGGARRSWSDPIAVLGLGAGAGLLALGAGLVAAGSALSVAVGSAELSAAAVLIAGSPWVLPAMFTVMVFGGMVVAVYLIGGRGPSTPEDAAGTGGGAVPVAPVAADCARDASPAAAPFELRSPDRALHEVSRGLFRGTTS